MGKIKGKKMVNIRITDQEKASLIEKAKKYTRGNLTAWIIMSGSNHIPFREGRK